MNKSVKRSNIAYSLHGIVSPCCYCDATGYLFEGVPLAVCVPLIMYLDLKDIKPGKPATLLLLESNEIISS